MRGWSAMIAKNASLALVHDIGGEGALEDDDTGPIGECANQLRPQRAPIRCRGFGAE